MSLRHDDERTFRTQVVAAALLDDPHRPQRLIAAQRAYPESLRGLWELPGGKQEPGAVSYTHSEPTRPIG